MPAHFLDDIAIASSATLSAAAMDIARIIPTRIGAIVEYELQRCHNRHDLPQLSSHSDSLMVARIERLVAGNAIPFAKAHGYQSRVSRIAALS